MASASTSRSWQVAWRRSVAIVAVLVSVTLGASGYINFRLTSIYEASSREGAALARQHAALGALQPAMGEVPTVIDELLESRDVARASRRLDAALAALDSRFEAVGRELLAGRDSATQQAISRALRDVELAADRIGVEARQLLSHVRRREDDAALARMSAMNRRSHEAGLALARAQDALRALQLAHDAANARAAHSLRGIETALLALAAIVATLVLFHGRRIAVALRLAEEEAAALAARTRESDERFAFAARGTLDGIWDLDPASGSAFYSERLLELLGLPPDTQLDPRRFDALIHPEDMPRVEAARAAAREGRKPYSVEMRLALPSGEYRWFLARGQGKWDESGRLVRLTGSISDISARKAGEMRLAASTARLAAETSRLAAFVEHAPAAIAMFDSSLRYVAASRRWMDTFLRGSRDVAGQPFYELFADIPRAWRTELSRVLEGEIVGADDERWRPARGGPERHLRWEARPWHEQGSAQPGVLLFAQDITRDREHEAQLERMRDAADAANRAKSEFLATMSHEIRTPMNGVLGFTQLLLDTPLNPEQREFARTIDASGRSLLALLNDILDYSKIEAGKLLVEVARFDLRAVVEEVAALLSSQCHEKRLGLRVDYAADAPAGLLGDAARVRQVLTNLVGNAIKFTAHGEVRVEVRRDGPDGVRVSVTDTGIGIPEEALPGLFNKFVQVDSTTTRRFGGTGLGLAISRQLVELMHGTIGARSREGAGSTFWFRLPAPPIAVDADEPSWPSAGPDTDAATRVAAPSTTPGSAGVAGAAHAPPPRPPADTSGPAILVVDDQPVNRSLAARVLAKLGHEADVAEDGAVALELVARRAYRLILMDCQMPRCDGFEATAGIRALEHRDPARPRATIIALTAGATPTERDRALNAGMQGLLGKPLVPVELKKVLDQWLAPSTRPQALPEPDAEPSLGVAG